MPAAGINELVERLTILSERAASGTGIEIVEVQLRSAGKARLLRLYIDKEGGVTHGDCELVSHNLEKLLDEQDAIPGEQGYTLEVSSPGAERKLSKPRDFERAMGRKIRLSLREPVDGLKALDGKLTAVTGEALDVETGTGNLVHIPLNKVQKANLKFEW